MLHELQKMNYPAARAASSEHSAGAAGAGAVRDELFITRPTAAARPGWHERSDPSFIRALFYDSHKVEFYIVPKLSMFHTT